MPVDLSVKQVDDVTAAQLVRESRDERTRHIDQVLEEAEARHGRRR